MVESAKGNVRETIGNVTGDKSQQAKGMCSLSTPKYRIIQLAIILLAEVEQNASLGPG